MRTQLQALFDLVYASDSSDRHEFDWRTGHFHRTLEHLDLPFCCFVDRCTSDASPFSLKEGSFSVANGRADAIDHH